MYDNSVFVLTDSGWKNSYSIQQDNLVATLSKGKVVYVTPDEINTDTYTGELIKVYKKDKLQFTFTPEQRVFWFKNMITPVIGSAKEFAADVLNSPANSVYIVIYGEDKSLVSITSRDIDSEYVGDRDVWSVTSKVGNLVIKSSGHALVMSD